MTQVEDKEKTRKELIEFHKDAIEHIKFHEPEGSDGQKWAIAQHEKFIAFLSSCSTDGNYHKGFENGFAKAKELHYNAWKHSEEQMTDLEKYISNKLRELGADLINHKPYSFNRGLNVGKTNAYQNILNRLNARKED